MDGSCAYQFGEEDVQAFLVVANLIQSMLLGLYFMAMVQATVNVVERTFVFRSVDNRQTVCPEDDAELFFGAIGTGKNWFLAPSARARRHISSKLRK